MSVVTANLTAIESRWFQVGPGIWRRYGGGCGSVALRRRPLVAAARLQSVARSAIAESFRATAASAPSRLCW